MATVTSGSAACTHTRPIADCGFRRDGTVRLMLRKEEEGVRTYRSHQQCDSSQRH